MFKLASILTALLCAALFPLLLISPADYVQTYGLLADAGADFLGRRASPMFLGLAVLLWLARDAPPSPLRRAISLGLAATWAGIAVTGLYEYGRGTADVLIVGAAAVEMVLAFLFLAAAKR